jgi:microcystin-dependent protein
VGAPFLAEIRIFGFNFPPYGWALCNGQILPIAQNTALFSLLGTYYGGDGTKTFALPNFQGRVPLHVGSGFDLGQAGGEESHALTVGELPSHTHTPVASPNGPDKPAPGGNYWSSSSGILPYAAAANSTMPSGAIAPAGGGQLHQNLSPYLVLNFCIALQGTYPSRN